MKWLDWLESKIGFLAFPGLIRIIVAFQALVFILEAVHPGFAQMLVFDRNAVFAGQFWRVFTFVFIPPAMGFLGPLGVLIALYFLWFLGEGLEQAWGDFKLNLYVFVGILGAAVTVLFVGTADSSWLILSILFAFATLYPDFQILLFFILPIKMKWVAWIALFFTGMGFLAVSFGMKALILVSLGNYILFFGPTLLRKMRNRQEVLSRREKHTSHSIPEGEPLHRCAVCNRTETSNPELDFRVSSDGEEYCTDHLPSKTGAG
jgi:hypothetical protein